MPKRNTSKKQPRGPRRSGTPDPGETPEGHESLDEDEPEGRERAESEPPMGARRTAQDSQQTAQNLQNPPQIPPFTILEKVSVLSPVLGLPGHSQPRPQE